MEVTKADGTVSHDVNDVLEKWKADFDNLLNPSNNTNKSDESIFEINIATASNNRFDNARKMNGDIALCEVEDALRRAKSGKAPGCDDIPVVVLKNGVVANLLLKLFNACFSAGLVPDMWRRGIISPIPKSSTMDPRDPMGYRGITLAPATYKLYCSVLNERLSKFSNDSNILADNQNGFRRKRSTIDHVSALTSIIETRKKQRQSTFSAFIDFKQAYDREDRNILLSK
ncbi:hypothetical protein SNE40_009730 [Patella caerulea]|uniref:Reverse transcriptase domain-containing protein n=1 Tax=Patella caerulea TaxID=87958 RepID=A0AAN8JZ76_PATCE